MKDENNNLFPDNNQPILTPEEIELIKSRRMQNQAINRNNDLSSNLNSGEKKQFHVNIPTHELYESYDYNNNYNNRSYFERNNNDVSFENYNNVPRERYDHERYLAEQQQHQSPPPQKSSKSPKNKKKHGCSTLFLSFFLIIALVIGSCYAYVYHLSSQVKQSELDDNYSHLMKSNKIKNILLIGLDKEDGGISRSDTMMLLSIDKENKTLKLTSFLRDLWVSIPENGEAKLNASYAYGGPQLTVDTIESNFGIDIDHFVLVDFEMFEEIIDSLGGVTVDITENEAKFLRNNTRVKVPAGENTLNGEYALIYARIRKLDSDFQRTQRQRKVISAIIEKAKKTNPVKLANMLSDIMPLIETDIEPMEMTNLAFSAIKYIQYDIDQLQVPADNAYSSQMIYGQSALVPDMEKNIDNVKDFIY